MAQATSNGITIEYEQHGEGEPLLLVMGLGGQLTDWPRGFIDTLVDAGFQVTVFDNRDIGLSTEFDWEPPSPVKALAKTLVRRPPKAGYTIPDMAEDAAGLMDTLDIESAHVVGMSMGGMIAQQLTIDHPSRVRSLTSIMSNPGDGKSGRIATKVMAKLARMPAPTLENAADRSVENFLLWSGPHFDPDEHRARATRSVERSFRPISTQRQTTAIMASPDRTPGLQQVEAPTLVVHGLVDKLVKPTGGIATAKAVPGSRLLMFPDMGHDLPEPRFAEIAAEIRDNADRATLANG
ncbi:alpha/beta fold hydrolase [Ilumatobacter nonamiensis]|uniref:alpha/beta fold hydrolase n=1 Tax=Ilumatobacter nonamiensis TaxID=467093 RepID=UPI00058ACB95|nr:alpha/beta hydrolase [Ilumatobacter nonamiensis]